ncbi:MAG: hypothetical protein AAGE01_23920 [Pseudomonadota bacterium]
MEPDRAISSAPAPAAPDDVVPATVPPEYEARPSQQTDTPTTEPAPPVIEWEVVAPPRKEPPGRTDSAPGQPPTVEVHIGTIEVVSEAPAQAPESPRRPAVPRGLGLDEFLDGAGGR